ncbi:hypothetical protein QPK31_13635 [Massilia sp. YIM B02769]|jgi:hypothetical protein|uniref:hypothetical protein n=1 Tax=unclassified Massilia TaxID=2609279 RepID=UPI0025B6E145|nr:MULTISPECIES: hypothetical protein [unclassified Massilia]MDN4059263.1 hypothetical protein [Massilia sp. YIM B02769]
MTAKKKTSEKTLVPFANEADVLHIGDLMVENRLDRITLSGDVDLTLDQPGLALARRLHALLGDIVGKMEAQELPAQLPPPDVQQVENPFN